MEGESKLFESLPLPGSHRLLTNQARLRFGGGLMDFLMSAEDRLLARTLHRSSCDGVTEQAAVLHNGSIQRRLIASP